jgi:hypothetical protein
LFHGKRTNVEPIDLSILAAQVEHIHATTATGYKNVSCGRDLIFDRLLFNHFHQSWTGGRLVPRVDALFPELVPAIYKGPSGGKEEGEKRGKMSCHSQ